MLGTSAMGAAFSTASNLKWSNDSFVRRRNLALGIWIPASGEESGAAKLTWQAVDESRRKYQQEERSMHSLAREYGVAYATARSVIKEITWKKDERHGA